MIASDGRILAREAAMTTFAAGTIAAVLLWAGPPGVDLAAHAYQRTLLAHHGFVLWNNFWYAGRYSFVTYSFIYYPLAVVFGIKALALATICAAALAFTLLVWREWGPVGRLSSRTFAVLWAGIALSAAFPFALGVALALLGLTAMQRGRLRLFAVLVLLTLLASPLAFLLLVVLLAGVGRLDPDRGSTSASSRPSSASPCCSRSRSTGSSPAAAASRSAPGTSCRRCCSACSGSSITRDVPKARPLRGIFWIYLAVCLAAYLVPSALGSNVERLRYAALPIVLLAVSLRRWRPGVADDHRRRARDGLERHAARLQLRAGPVRPGGHPGVLGLDRRRTCIPTSARASASRRSTRPTTGRRSTCPSNGIPIVRGWYRQADFPENELLYDAKLSPGHYRAWLRQLGVRYVVISDAPPDYSSQVEAQLIRSGRSGLVPVFRAAARDRLRGAARAPARHRAGPRERPVAVAEPGGARDQQARQVPRRAALVAVLGDAAGLRLARGRRHGAAERPPSGPRPAELQPDDRERARDAGGRLRPAPLWVGGLTAVRCRA